MIDTSNYLISEAPNTIGVVFYDYSVKAGGQRVAANVFNHLCNQGYRVVFISVFFRNKQASFALDEKIKLYPLNEKECHFREVRKPSVKEFSEIVERENIKVLIAEGFSADLISAIVSQKCKIPFIHCEHTSLENRYYSEDLASRIYRYLGARKSKAIVALTEGNKKSFEKKYRGVGKKTFVIPNWVENDDEKVGSYKKESRIIVSIGRADPVKGFDRLIDIAARVKNRCKGWEWHIWGDFDSEFGRKIEAEIDTRGLNDFVKIRGVTESIGEVYSGAGVLVMTSYYEGMPMVLLEAGLYGIPLLSFDIPTGPNEIIVNGVNGYLVEDGEIDEMANRICELVVNESERLRL